MTTYTITFKRTAESSVKTNLHFSKAQLLSILTNQEFSVSSLPSTVNVISTKLEIIKGEQSENDILSFQKPEDPLIFRSKTKPQILIIDCDLNQGAEGVGQERFRLKTIACDRPDLIDSVQVQHTNMGWRSLLPWEEIKDDVNSLMITFNMSTDVRTEPFPLVLKVKDLKTGITEDCDPGMGNDPPK